MTAVPFGDAGDDHNVLRVEGRGGILDAYQNLDFQGQMALIQLGACLVGPWRDDMNRHCRAILADFPAQTGDTEALHAARWLAERSDDPEDIARAEEILQLLDATLEEAS